MNEPPVCRRSWRRRIGRFLLLAGTTYLLIVLVMWFFENNLVFRPYSPEEGWEPAPNAELEEVEFTASDGVKLHAWYFPHPTCRDVILYCHGNGGNVTHNGPRAVRLRDRLQCGVLLFDYPGYGKSAGKPSEQGCYSSAEAAFDWLTKSRNISPERIMLYGESLGGGVAVELACRRDHRALILVRTFTSLPATAKRMYPWLPVHWLMRNRFDNESKLCSCCRPVFITSADGDSVVPFEHGQSLYNAVRGPKHYFAETGATHETPLPDEFFELVQRFLAEHAP